MACGRQIAESGPPLLPPPPRPKPLTASPAARSRPGRPDYLLTAVPTLDATPCVEAGPQPGDRVLSIQQPYASLIVHGIKRVENRSWDTPYRGLVWIHASRGLNARDWAEFVSCPQALFEGLPQPRQLPRGAIVGCVDVAMIHQPGDVPSDLDPLAKAFRNAACFGWLLVNPQRLAVPIPTPGKLNLWTWRG
jgi:hypothetical protein